VVQRLIPSVVGGLRQRPILDSSDGACEATVVWCIVGALAGITFWQWQGGMGNPDLGPMGQAGLGYLEVLPQPLSVRIRCAHVGF
jgi:hypothetical protein